MNKTIEYVNTHEVFCDGGETHPLVYYTLKEYKDGTKAACFYCGKVWIFKDSSET